MTDGVRIAPFGDAAVLIELDGATGIAAARRARAVAAVVEAIRREITGLGVPVPGATSVLVPFDPRALEFAGVPRASRASSSRAGAARSLARRDRPRAASPLRRRRRPRPRVGRQEIGRSPADVIAVHAAGTYEVLFLGFAPGFAYLGELPPPLVMPRLATPRPRVPAGSVAIAGAMTAVYPYASAGGWRLLGRTDARLFDPGATPPARLRPGDRVRFVPA